MKNTRIFQGDIFSDSRGKVRFVNDFKFEGINRFYTIEHSDTDVIRAWQGHKRETKYFYVSQGSFRIKWIEIDNWERPGKELKIEEFCLANTKSEILIIPPGCVNGFQALEPNSVLTVFSDFSLEESKIDDFRFPFDYWQF